MTGNANLPYELLFTVMDAHPNGIVLVRDDTPIYWNRSFCQLLGYHPDSTPKFSINQLLSLTPQGARMKALPVSMPPSR